ncbi:hypothetical protein FG167_14475 [Lacinutrix sp. WUR7]|uniref:hypothetical protein n=1 Tax=Lacinutrix sp. WUR7 TaxID=2653681 RepID=UPI00193D4B54|nr:hypothetical protein [Lacinutrix sp. WUR7]QRM90391.1 hypothetical protein FG167_14475 [Lacinutrix sp. WUR7]
MKTRFLIIMTLFGFAVSTTAQEIAENAIGLRLGDANGLGASISYQRAILENNRLEVNFGWSNDSDYNGIKAVGLFQWVKPLEGDFNWYFGAGAGFASYTFDSRGYKNHKDSFVFVSGDIGVEYNFDFPLLLSLDLRPELGFGDGAYDNNDLDIDVGVSARYRF